MVPVPKPRHPGHGRNAAQAYSGAPIVECDHPDLEPGDRCPQCDKGRVYDSPPRSIVKVVGQAPLGATVYKLQRLRCRLCDTVFTAPLPAAVASLPKYDSSCASMIAVLRYGNGMPHFRLEGLQASLYMPLPDATQWDIVSKAVPVTARGLRGADPPGRAGAAAAQRRHAHEGAQPDGASATAPRPAASSPRPRRSTPRASSPSCRTRQRQRKVVLFFTGHAHAGKNMERVLAHRAQELAPAMQMCDALAANVAGEFKTVLANCLTHGRRQVADVAEQFPEAARHVIEALAEVYKHDATCRHGRSCQPSSACRSTRNTANRSWTSLQRWMNEQFEQRLVEPNSGLGKALRYLIRHWDELTLFLRKAGAPLDNNLCEQILKRAILHRKGSMFYKTVSGAEVGDIYMSLIHTCRLCDVNPFDYLNALQQHAQDVISRAARWLPWNYREQLAAASVSCAVQPIRHSGRQAQRAPRRRGVCARRVAGHEQHLQLAGLQRAPGLLAVGPPGELARWTDACGTSRSPGRRRPGP